MKPPRIGAQDPRDAAVQPDNPEDDEGVCVRTVRVRALPRGEARGRDGWRRPGQGVVWRGPQD